MELAETLMFAGVIRWYVVGEPEEEMMEGLSRDEVEARFLDASSMWSGSDLAAGNPRDSFHLLESMYDRGMELVFEGKMIFEIAAGGERFRAEGALVTSGQSTEKTVEVELAECGSGVSTTLTTEGRKVTGVHSRVPTWRR